MAVDLNLLDIDIDIYSGFYNQVICVFFFAGPRNSCAVIAPERDLG